MTNADVACLPGPDDSPWPSQAASLSLHVGVLSLLAFLVPPPLASGETDAEDVAWIRHMLASSGAAEDDATLSGAASGGDATPGQGADTAGGGATTLTSAVSLRHGPGASKVRTSEDRAERLATFGMIGLLSDPPSDDPASSPWGRSAAGAPWRAELDSLWGDAIGDSFGIGGVGLSGVGEGGGGRGVGIEIGGIGRLGNGPGAIEGRGAGFACGCGSGNLGGSHRTRAPVLRCGPPPGEEPGRGGGCAAKVNGRLPPEAVQRVVRQSFGRFRLCYEEGLQRDPLLAGRVSVKFVIDRAGAVSMAEDAGSDLRDASAVSCVVRGFQSLSFPQPEGGIVTVVYPLTLSPE